MRERERLPALSDRRPLRYAMTHQRPCFGLAVPVPEPAPVRFQAGDISARSELGHYERDGRPDAQTATDAQVPMEPPTHQFLFGPSATLDVTSVVPDCEDRNLGPEGEFRTNLYAKVRHPGGETGPVPLLLQPKVPDGPEGADLFVVAPTMPLGVPVDATVTEQEGHELCVFSQATEEADDFPNFNEILSEDEVCIATTGTSTELTFNLRMAVGTCTLSVTLPAQRL